MPKKRSSPWSVADARAVFVELAASGLPLSDFARREGIQADRLYRWRRELGESAKRVVVAPSSAPPAVVELRAGPRAAERVEVVLASGVTLRVTETIDPAALARLIAALR
jgi:transposase-like protein